MRKILIIVIAILLIFLIFFAVDYKRAKENMVPLFAIKIDAIKDDRNAEYYGIGYKVIKYVNIDNTQTKIEFGPWSMKFNDPFYQAQAASFYGKIINVGDKGIIVEPLEGEQIRNSTDKIAIALSDTSNAKIGGKVFVKYTGEVMESYPAQIKLISIEFIYNYSLATKTIKTGLYKDNITFPKKDIIKSRAELDAYLQVFNHEFLIESLKEYNEDYFKNKILAIVTLQESSGSIVDSIGEVITRENKVLEVNVERIVPEVGTDDMAMWHLIIEAEKDSIESIDVKINADKLSMYENLGTFKGIELYTWKVGDIIYCGIMSGTNRNKTTEEINVLKANPATLEEMNKILNQYDRNQVFLILTEGLSEEDIQTLTSTLNIRYTR
jgi:hypothetical protein